MQGISQKVEIFKLATDEKQEIVATTGQWLQASRLIRKWIKSGIIETEEPWFSFTWFYLAARSRGLEGTSSQDAQPEHVERFFDIWDALIDEGEGAEAPFPELSD